jgi:hypothetical protein
MEAHVKKRILLVLGMVLLVVSGMAIAQPQREGKDVEPVAKDFDAPRPAPIGVGSRHPDRPSPSAAPVIVALPLPAAAPAARSITPTPFVPSDCLPPIPTATVTHAAIDFAMPIAPPTVIKAEDMSIDQLLHWIETLRTQREEMEKKEKAMLKVLRQKAEKLNQRISNLDGERLEPQIVPQAAAAPVLGGPAR